MDYEEFSKVMIEFDKIINRCLKCNYHSRCPMHRISAYVKEIGKTEFLAKIADVGIDGIEKELGIAEN